MVMSMMHLLIQVDVQSSSSQRANPMCRVGRVDRVDRVDRVGRFGRVGSVRANVQANVPTPPSNPTAHPTYCSFFKRQCPSVRLG